MSLERRTRLRSVGARKRRTAPAEAAFRKALLWRSAGECEIASADCPEGRHAGQHPHHVFPADRDRGVHDPARGLWVCAAGHDWVHLHPAESYELGWLGRG